MSDSILVQDPNLIVEWLHDGNLIRHSNRLRIINDFGFNILEIAPLSVQDAGTWMCRVNNSRGTAETKCTIQVRLSGEVIVEDNVS